MIRPVSADYTGARKVFLLELLWGGTVYRVATEDITLEGDDGSEYFFAGDLSDIEWEETLNLYSTATDALSIPLELDLADVDVQARNRRHKLGSATGELSFVLLDVCTGVARQSYEKRYRILKGAVSQPQFAHPERDASWARFSLEERPFDDRGFLLPSTARVDGASFPFHNTTASGKVYPVVFGFSCGFSATPAATGTFWSGSPGYRVRDVGLDRWLLLSLGEVAAEMVTVADSSGNRERFDVLITKDGHGQVVSVVNLYGASTLDLASEEYWVSWGYDPGVLADVVAVAGILKVDGVGPITGAGDLLVWLLSRSSIGVDLPAWQAWAVVLNRYKLAGFIQDPALSPWGFISQHLLKLLPVSLLSGGPSGIRPLVHDYAAPPSRVDAEVTLGEDWFQSGPVTTRTKATDIRNRITLEYSHDPVGNAYRRATTLDSLVSPTLPASVGALHSKYIEESQGEWGVISEVVSTEYIYDDVTATLIAGDLVMRKGFLEYEVSFEADVGWGWLQLGDRIKVTADELAWTEHVTTILGRRYLGEAWAFTLLTRDDPVRDR